jgi:putative membrane protein
VLGVVAMNIVSLFIAWLVVAASFYFISKLPFIGVEIDTLQKTLVSAAVFGIVTALVRPLLEFAFKLPNILTFGWLDGFFSFLITVICFAIAAYLVRGFRLRFGIWSAILGALTLSIVMKIIYTILPLNS